MGEYELKTTLRQNHIVHILHFKASLILDPVVSWSIYSYPYHRQQIQGTMLECKVQHNSIYTTIRMHTDSCKCLQMC